MGWFRKLLACRGKKALPKKLEEFFKKVCEELGGLGEMVIACEDDHFQEGSHALSRPGPGQIWIRAYWSESFIISIPALEHSDVYGGFLDDFLQGRRVSCVIGLRDLDQNDPKEIAREFYKLADEWRMIADEVKKIQSRVWKRIAKIRRGAEGRILRLLR